MRRAQPHSIMSPDRIAGSLRTQPIQSRAEARVAAIVAGVDAVIAADGIDSLTTTRVARAAGVSVGSVYRYFPDMTALLEEYIERYRAALAEQAATFLEDPPKLDDVEAVSAALIQRSADMLLKFPAFALVRLWRYPDSGELLAAPIRQQETAMIKLLLTSDPMLSPAENDIDRVADMLIETSMTLLALAPREPEERAVYVADVVTMISAFIRAKAATTG